MTYFRKQGILNPISARDDLTVVREVLVAPHQNLLARVGIGGIAPDAEMDSGETREEEWKKTLLFGVIG